MSEDMFMRKHLVKPVLPPIESIFSNQELQKSVKSLISQKTKKKKLRKKEERKHSEAEPSQSENRVSFHIPQQPMPIERDKPVRLQSSLRRRNRKNSVSRSVTRQKSLSSQVEYTLSYVLNDDMAIKELKKDTMIDEVSETEEINEMINMQNNRFVDAFKYDDRSD